MAYTRDWNLAFRANTKGLPKVDIALEIGCFEGLTSTYIVDNLLKPSGVLLCIDPLTDNYLNTNLTSKYMQDNATIYTYFKGQYDRFMENTSAYRAEGRIILHRGFSFDILPKLLPLYRNSIGLTYIDGDHRASAVYKDASQVLPLCSKGGFILFDDYRHKHNSYGDEAPFIGIDKFVSDYETDLTKPIIKKHQLLVQKV
jgi:hypothetical protein